VKDYDKLEVVTRATAGPALTTQSGWAAELVVNVTQAFLGDLAAARSISGVLFGPDGANGQVLQPGTGSIRYVIRDPAAGRVSGAFVGEAGAIPYLLDANAATSTRPAGLHLAFAPGRPSFTVIASSSVPAGKVIAIDLDSLVWVAVGPPAFALGSQGALHEEDTTRWRCRQRVRRTRSQLPCGRCGRRMRLRSG
jgi:hypothetical protein